MEALHTFDSYIVSLYDKYHDLLLRWCYRYCSYDPELAGMAEDFVQDAFVKALNQPEKVAHHPKPLAWLIVACKNSIMNFVSRRKTKRKHGAVSYTLDANSPVEDKRERIEEWAEAEDTKEFLDEILAILTDAELDVYHDYFIQGLTIAETARKRKKSIAAVKDILHKIREKARSLRDRDHIFLLFFCSNGILSLLIELIRMEGGMYHG